LNDDFGPNSDVDVLVEFKAGTRLGLIRLTGLEFELSEIIGRKVDLNTPDFISKYYRSKVMAEKEVQYAEA
jgi:predicted nucleotidyltransferase